MKKKHIFAFLILFSAFCVLFFSSCSYKKDNNVETHKNGVIEEYEGKVTYFGKVVIDKKNYLLRIKTNDSEISFNVLPTTKIVGGKTVTVGDNVKIKDIKEDDISTYREAVEIKILSKNK